QCRPVLPVRRHLDPHHRRCGSGDAQADRVPAPAAPLRRVPQVAMRMIILGPPGAGKGTQAARIAVHFGIPATSTGAIFAANAKNETELGKQVKDILASGGYVSDDITNAIVEDRLQKEDCQDGFLLDGYPRTTAQVEALDAMLAKAGKTLERVLE